VLRRIRGKGEVEAIHRVGGFRGNLSIKRKEIKTGGRVNKRAQRRKKI